MSIKKLFKILLGKNYQKLRLRYIVDKSLGLKLKLNKKIIRQQQSMVNEENGYLIDRTKNNYLTYHLRPKEFHNFKLESTCTIDEKIAVIIQGPIQENFEFLKNTLNIYKKIFKNSLIIVSTWKNENIELINSLKDDRIDILFNEEPKKTISNIDHQIHSTHAALNLAVKKGAQYSIKTRADVRINKNNLETFLISLIKTFPAKKNKLNRSRIIVPSLNTMKYKIYGLTDIVMIGKTEDLIEYFDTELFKDGLKKFDLDENNFLKDGTPIIAESFLCARYVNKLDGCISWDLKNWWQSLKNYFCVIENSSLDLFWQKYEWEFEYRYCRTYSEKFARGIDFQDWLSLYNNFDNNWQSAFKEHEKYDHSLKRLNPYKN